MIPAGRPDDRRSPMTLPVAEIKFLEYRLEVVSSWPPSARKEATIDAILIRLSTTQRVVPF
jgi:hypothetical protein